MWNCFVCFGGDFFRWGRGGWSYWTSKPHLAVQVGNNPALVGRDPDDAALAGVDALDLDSISHRIQRMAIVAMD